MNEEITLQEWKKKAKLEMLKSAVRRLKPEKKRNFDCPHLCTAKYDDTEITRRQILEPSPKKDILLCAKCGCMFTKSVRLIIWSTTCPKRTTGW